MVTTAEEAEVDGEIMNISPSQNTCLSLPIESPFVAMQMAAFHFCSSQLL